MIDPQLRYTQLCEKLRARDYRMTPQRLALIRLLAASTSHPSAAQLFDDLKEDYPTMSFGTVYKTLALLKEMGEVLEMGFSDDDNRYDGNNPHPHAHLVCVRCHKIEDAPFELAEPQLESMAQASGFTITGQRMEFYGLCAECQAKEA